MIRGWQGLSGQSECHPVHLEAVTIFLEHRPSYIYLETIDYPVQNLPEMRAA